MAKKLKSPSKKKSTKKSTTSTKPQPVADHPNRLFVADYNEEALFADGFDDCIIGVSMRCGGEALAAYDYDAVIDKLVKDSEMSYEEAVEYFEFNIAGAWVGDMTPIFIKKVDR